jgi:RNA polymerase sigma-70 factor, ECF subfamily
MSVPLKTERPQPSEDQVFKDQLVAIIPSLRAFARALCGNREMADDMAQDAMVRAWAARNSYTPDTNFRAWMFKILRNNYYTAFRKNSRMTSWDPEVAERLLVVGASQEMTIHLADVAAALGKLPAEQREVLMMVAAGGLSYEDAADTIGCAVGTVKSRVARGRAALARLIDGPADAISVKPTKRMGSAPANN